MVKQGYFDDEFLEHFVSKQPRRSPVIHLGYHVRATVISYVLKEFYDKQTDQASQVRILSHTCLYLNIHLS